MCWCRWAGLAQLTGCGRHMFEAARPAVQKLPGELLLASLAHQYMNATVDSTQLPTQASAWTTTNCTVAGEQVQHRPLRSHFFSQSIALEHCVVALACEASFLFCMRLSHCTNQFGAQACLAGKRKSTTSLQSVKVRNDRSKSDFKRCGRPSSDCLLVPTQKSGG